MSNDTRKCEHIKTNGIRCGSPALRDENICYFHTALAATSRTAPKLCG